MAGKKEIFEDIPVEIDDNAEFEYDLKNLGHKNTILVFSKGGSHVETPFGKFINFAKDTVSFDDKNNKITFIDVHDGIFELAFSKSQYLIMQALFDLYAGYY